MSQIQSIVLGGGCFWCLEAVYQRIDGVVKITSGYTGGQTENPNYQQVSGGRTGHAEVVKIEFDKTIIGLEQIFDIFWHLHDPTTLNKQGHDLGTQYRSVIFYADEPQLEAAQKSIENLKNIELYSDPIVTELKPLGVFYPAEDYHQNYFNNHQSEGYCQVVISPKLSKLKDYFKPETV